MPVFMVGKNLSQDQQGRDQTIGGNGHIDIRAVITWKEIRTFGRMNIVQSLIPSQCQLGCPFSVKIRPTEDGQKLIILMVNSDHNHDIDKRKLDDECRKEVLRMLQMKTSKNLITRHLRLQAGKVVTLKDLHNLARTLGTVTSNTEITIQESENPPVSEPAASLSPHHKMSLAQPSLDYCSSSPLLQEPFIPHIPQQLLLTSDEETASVSIISSSSQTLLPSQMIKNKRPIAKETTMVRFPIKCKIKKIITPTVPLPFVHKSSVEKEVLILSWILSNPCIVRTRKVRLMDIPKDACSLPLRLLDSNVDIIHIKKYFEEEAWLALCSRLDDLEKSV